MRLNSYTQTADPRAASTQSAVAQLAGTKTAVQIALLSAQSSGVAELYHFIHQRYAETYRADVTHFLPYQLASVNEQGIQGVLGLRPGAEAQFFSEQYLDTSIEQAISAAVHTSVTREHIIETGNLASVKGGSQRLFIVLTELLYQSGFHWICFTATPQVEALLHRLGFAPELLAAADPSRLSDTGLRWGSYYLHKPNVLVGDVRKARATLTENEIALRILQEHAEQLEEAVSVLKTTAKRADHSEAHGGG